MEEKLNRFQQNNAMLGWQELVWNTFNPYCNLWNFTMH